MFSLRSNEMSGRGEMVVGHVEEGTKLWQRTASGFTRSGWRAEDFGADPKLVAERWVPGENTKEGGWVLVKVASTRMALGPENIVFSDQGEYEAFTMMFPEAELPCNLEEWNRLFQNQHGEKTCD